MTPPTLLIVDDDESVGFGLSAALACDGRRILVCRDVESAELILEHERVDDVITDMKLTGSFRFEGLDFLEHARRYAPAARLILMSGYAADDVADEARRLGAAAVLRKPFELTEVEPLLAAPAGEEPATVTVLPTLDEIIASAELRPRFQPIVSLDGEVRAFESLAAFRALSPLRRPDLLFAYAERKQRVIDLEIGCVERTLREAASLPSEALLFVNGHPAAVGDPAYAGALLAAAARSGVSMRRLVVELTEQQPIHHADALLATIDALRLHGVRFAFDDVGSAYSHLPLIDRIRPSFLKISQQFGTGFETDETRTKLVRNLVTLGRDFHCEVILEGVEEAITADAARQLGIPLAQGYYFGRPADAETFAGRMSSPAAAI